MNVLTGFYLKMILKCNRYFLICNVEPSGLHLLCPH
ncbi:hypothetical protein T11_3051 [Trichinella zimbabwensis]|uniref:Uncharacterized protein n=1 Tax=Trichinella zimbabwensis TaxID=268475 RepID=A0A0V1G6G5_9BILA|nr:hypothetical protein T11_3051 [Trichinella zimbabwensis]